MKRLTPDDLSKLALFAAILFGGWLRFWPVLQAGFPINDGGMFYSMIEDLYANAFILPKFTSYNALNIPYAYPPLAFYLGVALKTFFGLKTIHILMFLPPTLATLSIAAFARMAGAFFPASWPKTMLATMAFAFLPRSYSWFIMGGGLTRSLGQMFLLLMLAATLRLYRRGEQKDIWTVGLLGGLVVLSHPEAMIHAITAAMLFWAFLGRSRRSFLHSLAVAAIVIAVSAPWWGSVLWQHGAAPFLSALQTGEQSAYRTLTPFFFAFGEERLASVITVLGMVGLACQLAHGQYFLPAWLAIHFITQPRSATAIAIYPLALLSAITLNDVIFPALNKSGETSAHWLKQKPTQVALIALLAYLLLSSSIYDLEIANNHLSPVQREAMMWVREETPSGSRFLILDGSSDPMLQKTAEWFPALTNRQSVITLQGKEWTAGGRFVETINAYGQFRQCYFQDAACLQQQVDRLGLAFDYIYLDRLPADSGRWVAPPLLASLEQDSDYELVYQAEATSIFRRK